MQETPRNTTLVEWIVLIGMLSVWIMVVIPNFAKFPVRMRQAEAKTNLKKFFAAAKAYHALHGTYMCGDCGFRPEAGHHYTYQFNANTTVAAAAASPRWRCHYQGQLPAQQTSVGFVATAAANIDGDPACDSWAIDQNNHLVNLVNDLN